MKLEITWSDGSSQSITNMPDNAPSIKGALNGTIFDTIQVFAPQKTAINFKFARIVKVVDED